MYDASNTRVWKMLRSHDPSPLLISIYPMNQTSSIIMQLNEERFHQNIPSSIIDDDYDDEVLVSKRCVEVLPSSRNRD